MDSVHAWMLHRIKLWLEFASIYGCGFIQLTCSQTLSEHSNNSKQWKRSNTLIIANCCLTIKFNIDLQIEEACQKIV